MQRIRDGNIRVMTAPEALDHFQQLTTLAKDLLSDFREVEQNFRKLDRQVREQIATWDGTQGELLESIFANQQDISSSLQGRTFQGFWDYLMSPQLRTELRDLLQRATQIEALAKHGQPPRRHQPAPGLAARRRADPGNRPPAVPADAPAAR